MSTPSRAAALVGRVTAAAAAVASAPVQRGSLRNAQAGLALHRAGPDGVRRAPGEREGAAPRTR